MGPPCRSANDWKHRLCDYFGAKAVYCDVFVMKIKHIQMHFMYKSQHAFQKQIMYTGSIVSEVILQHLEKPESFEWSHLLINLVKALDLRLFVI